MKRLLNLALVVFVTSILTSAANARCTINTAGLSITPVTASTGTYTPPTTPTAQSVTFTVTGTYNSTTSTNPICGVAISFNRAASATGSMTRTTGGATMPYTITSAAGGGNTLLYTGGGLPLATQTVQITFTQAGTNLVNRAFTVTLTAFFLAQPGSPQGAGSYSDALTVHIFQVRQGTGALTDVGNRAFTATGTVNKACTIGGVYTPGADVATIPVSATGVVTTTAIPKSYATVVCNVLSNVQASSQSGAVKSAATAPSGFTNLINYSASATYSGATSTVNTATVGTATGVEAGTVATTTSATPSGTLTVTITPQTAASKLVSGSYSDTLRVTITPQ